MALMATLTPRRRSTDCFGGRLHRDTFGRYPCDDAPTSTSSKQAPAAAHGRKSRHADTPTVQPRKRVMENVVILKRGERIAPESIETPALAAAAAPAEKKADDYPEAAGQCGEPTEKAAADDGRCPAPKGRAKAKKAPTTKTVMMSANRVDSPVNKATDQAKKAEAAPTVYSGASFVVSPDPRKLPVPVFLFKPPGGSARLLARERDTAMATT